MDVSVSILKFMMLPFDEIWSVWSIGILAIYRSFRLKYPVGAFFESKCAHDDVRPDVFCLAVYGNLFFANFYICDQAPYDGCACLMAFFRR